MGPSKLVVIELKSFEVSREGHGVLITERGWKFVKHMRLGLATTCWFIKALEDCLKMERKKFYTGYREGDNCFIAQRCSNSQGVFMALVEYRGGGRRKCIFIPEDRDGKGWRKLTEILREAGNDGGAWRFGLPETMAVPSTQSYMEALQQPRAMGYLEQARLGVVSDISTRWRGEAALQRSGNGVVSVGALSIEGGGRAVVGPNKEKMIRVLAEMQKQMNEL